LQGQVVAVVVFMGPVLVVWVGLVAVEMVQAVGVGTVLLEQLIRVAEVVLATVAQVRVTAVVGLAGIDVLHLENCREQIQPQKLRYCLVPETHTQWL
jgi:hypothetical protein